MGSKQIKTGLVYWSKTIQSKTHFEAITAHPFRISAARTIYTIDIRPRRHVDEDEEGWPMMMVRSCSEIGKNEEKER